MVIAVLAIMFIITVQFSKNLGPESSLQATASEIADSIDLARTESVLRGRRVFFELDLGERKDAPQSYRAICEPAPGHEKDADDDEYMLSVRDWRLLPNGVRVESVVLGETDPYTNGLVQVAIQPDGSMPSHLIRLTCQQPGNEREHDWGWACVQVAGLLGQARVLNRWVEPEFLREDTFQ